jgi:hypothetical protein
MIAVGLRTAQTDDLDLDAAIAVDWGPVEPE